MSDPGPTAAEIASMNATAEAIRGAINTADPKSPFFGREDLRAAAETSIAVARLRSSTTEPDQSPQTLVERQHAAAWSYAMPPGLRDQLDTMRAHRSPRPGRGGNGRVEGAVRRRRV